MELPSGLCSFASTAAVIRNITIIVTAKCHYVQCVTTLLDVHLEKAAKDTPTHGDD